MRPLFALILCLFLSCLVSAQEENPTPYEIALQRIEEARVSGATFLDLARLGLTELPAEIGSLASLEWLYIYDNQLTALPPEIGNLHELYYLVMRGNLLSDLPAEIGNLKKLCHINISNNRFQHLPLVLTQLPLLDEFLTVCFNEI